MIPLDDGFRLPRMQYDYFNVNESMFCEDMAKLFGKTSGTTSLVLLYRAYHEKERSVAQTTGRTVVVLE